MRVAAAFIVLTTAMAIVLARAPSAMACTVPPPGSPAEMAAKMSALQAEMWDKADLVFVARVEQSRPKPVPTFPNAAQVDLMPLTWLKAQGGPWQFELGHTGFTTCGPSPPFGAIMGKPGDTFIIFATGDTPGQETVLFTVNAEELLEPRALAALKAQD